MSPSGKAKNNGEQIKKIYIWRYAWLDVPTWLLVASYHWDFYSFGINKVVPQVIWIYWGVLAAYWIIKEQIRHAYGGVRARSGGFYVILWGAVMAEFAFMAQFKPATYIIPEYLWQTVLIVICGYIGILSARRLFSKVIEPVVDIIENTPPK